MYIYLSKILPLFVMPVGIVLVLSLFALVLLGRERRKAAGFFLKIAVLVMWVSSTPVVADALMGWMERDHPALALQEIPASRCLVLLGGVLEPALVPRIDTDMHEAIDRVRKAAQLYHAGKAEVILIAGGDLPWLPMALPESESMKALLMEWGVPAPVIVLESASHNTRENAINSIVPMQELVCGTPLLVTSAAHMKRAVAVFEKLGLDVFPVSADVRAVLNTNPTIMDFLPSANALKMTTDALRELLGRKVYEVQGWT